MSTLIEDYALIGDGHSAALVHRHGSIDWLCWPKFDADSCFCALLGEPENGHWSMAPSDEVTEATRRYLPGTAIIQSTLSTAHGELELTDWMPWDAPHRTLIRRVRCTRGKVAVSTDLLARFSYGKAIPWVRQSEKRWRIVMGPIVLWLDGGDELEHPDPDASLRGQFKLGEGETRDFVLQCVGSCEQAPEPIDVDQVLSQNQDFWSTWSARHTDGTPYTDAVLRSLITLKLLTAVSTGGMVAAPTTSLPESLGGKRNWDYRYCWLRDGSFTLDALIEGGYGEEAGQWRDWLVRSIAGHPSQLQIMYRIDGGRRVDEWSADWLSGYEGSAPVNLGNAAASQTQTDTYGEIFDALYTCRRKGLPPDDAAWELECRLIGHLSTAWRDAGNGIWEVRGDTRVFTLSRAMAWVAVNRAIRSAEEFDHPAPLEDWHALADTIHRDVLQNGFNAKLNSFTGTYGSEIIDASLLLLPAFGFIDANDPRMVGTVEAIERELTRDGLLMRYRHGAYEQDFAGAEGCFLACSFWLARVKILQGHSEKAREIVERVLALRNDVGLLAEEYDVSARRQCGNFPQALSHVALVTTVMAMDKKS